MYNVLRFRASSLIASNFSTTFFRYVRNPSKRAPVLKTIKKFKLKNMNDEDEEFDAPFDLQDISRRIRENDLDIEETFAKGEDFESIITESAKLYEHQVGEEKSRKSLIKKKLIERKYFKSGKETNLLTHAAKEQIRQLHKQNPLDWTPETLSKSFPISVDGVKKLLRCNFALKDPIRIKEHDEDVRKKWESLMSGKPSDEIYFHTRCLWNTGKIIRQNYNGNPNLPYTSNSTEQNVTKIEKPKPIGEFSAIIKNYIEYKKQKESPHKDNSELILPTKNEYNRRRLSGSEDQDLEASKFVKKSIVFKEDGDIVIKKKNVHADPELPFSQFKENMKHQLKRESKKSYTSKQYHQWIEQDSKEKDSKNQTSSYDIKEFISKIPKYSKENIKMKRGKNDSEDSLYLYTDEAGYQHPVGQRFKGKVSIPASVKKRKNSVYRIKQCVYDEDGEFLYKLPS